MFLSPATMGEGLKEVITRVHSSVFMQTVGHSIFSLTFWPCSMIQTEFESCRDVIAFRKARDLV